MTSDTVKPIFDHSEYTKTRGNPKKRCVKIFTKKHEKLNFLTNHVVPLWNLLREFTVSATSTASRLVLTEIRLGGHGIHLVTPNN